MLKRLALAGVLLALGLSCGQAQTNSTYIVVGLTGYDGAKTFDAVTPEAFAGLAHEAKLDNEALPRAYANLLSAWHATHAKKDKTDKGGKGGKGESHPEPFPLKMPAPREVRQLGSYPTADAAAKQKQDLEAQEAARLKRLEAEEERLKPTALADTGLKRPPQHAPTNQAKSPDAALVKATLDALISEIATVRADIAAGEKTDAKATVPGTPKPAAKAHKK